MADLAKLKQHGSGYGNASCDACHTRHAFSKLEARQPQARQTCHMGFDHLQWERYASSKHGVRALLKQSGVLPKTVAAPTCQTCHMQGVLEQPDGYSVTFPDLLTFHHAPRPIEQRLFVMHLKHRMRTFQGAFHANPDYALWYADGVKWCVTSCFNLIAAKYPLISAALAVIVWMGAHSRQL